MPARRSADLGARSPGRPKRGHGEGSVRRLASGRVRAEVMLDGERRSAVFDTRQQARDWLADLRTRSRKP